MNPTPPTNSPEEIAKARKIAIETRQARAKVKDEINSGSLLLSQVLDRGAYGRGDEAGDSARVVGRMDVIDAVLAIHGVGDKHLHGILATAGLVGTENLDTLNADQREALLGAVTDEGFEA